MAISNHWILLAMNILNDADDQNKNIVNCWFSRLQGKENYWFKKSGVKLENMSVKRNWVRYKLLGGF